MLYCVSACDDFISTNMGLVQVLVSLSPQLCPYAHKVQFHQCPGCFILVPLYPHCSAKQPPWHLAVGFI